MVLLQAPVLIYVQISLRTASTTIFTQLLGEVVFQLHLEAVPPPILYLLEDRRF